ncbi:MAG: beta-galactosidase [Candidatus Hydrogenedentes bacterium]|nr:beta-galactosidase [Candidatus Hydrogenedentota bacterium]
MLRFGACYHPEQWTPEQAKDHIKLMVKARMNLVRMGEACWARFEPEQGRFRFEWLDPIIESLHKENIATVLCTPTAVAPMWVFNRHGNTVRVDARGHKSPTTAPHACCVNAPEFQMLTDTIVQQLARHYAKVDGIIAWQVDNAPGSGGSARCYCEHCEAAFRKWLLAKYQTTENVNAAWCASSSGIEVRQWNEITLPRGERGRANAGHWLDFARFCSDSLVGFYKRQADILRANCPNHAITCNASPRANHVRLAKLAEHVTFPGRISTPDRSDGLLASYGHEITRWMNGPFWVMEQSCNAKQDRPGVMNESLDPAELRRWSWQAVANGAQGLCFYPFRSALGGDDNLRAGVLEWDGAPRRRYKEILRTGEEFAKIGPALDGLTIEAKVALMINFDSRWSSEAQPGLPGFHYDDHCFDLYRTVKRSGNACDVIDSDAELKKYTTVIAPCLSVIDDALAARLEKYVKEGGTLILTPQSGSREITNAMTTIPRPGLLAALIGATVEEIVVAPSDAPQTLNFARGAMIAQTCKVRSWFEVLEILGAEPVAEYLEGRLKGKAAIVRRGVGNGQVIYMGAYLPREVLEPFMREYLPDFPMKEIPEGVEVVQQKGEKTRIVFVLNHTGERQNVKLPGSFPDLITGETVGPSVTISANGILILKAQ